MHQITKRLIENIDLTYKDFSKKLIPDTKLKILGVRVPIIKKLAKEYKNTPTAQAFLSEDHIYYEEWFLHGLLISQIKDFNKAISLTEEFLPHIDNWGICDSFSASLKIFLKYPHEVYERILTWLKSDRPYVKRFAIVVLLDYFLDSNFDSKILTITSAIISDNYYVNMAIAWLFSVALVKHYNETITFIEQRTLPRFVHNKAIQKAIESFRISQDKKTYLRTLKIK